MKNVLKMKAREVQGSIFITAGINEKIELDISLFQAARVFEKTNGGMAFVIKDAPAIYKLDCDNV